MRYELYIDKYFLLQLCMNLTILMLVNHHFLQTAPRRRIFLGAFVGSCGGMFLWWFQVPIAARIVLAILAGTVPMVFLAFRIRSLEGFLQTLWIVMMYSFYVGGAVFFVLRILSRISFFRSGIVLNGMTVCVAGYFLLRKRSGQIAEQDKMKVMLTYKGKRVQISGFVDTGNRLYEPVSGFPVCIISERIKEQLIEEEDLFRVIPYTCVGKKHGYLYGYQIDSLCIYIQGIEKKVTGVYIAAGLQDTPGLSKQDEDRVDIILNSELLEGK